MITFVVESVIDYIKEIYGQMSSILQVIKSMLIVAVILANERDDSEQSRLPPSDIPTILENPLQVK